MKTPIAKAVMMLWSKEIKGIEEEVDHEAIRD